jgi:hypothetical protein
LRIWIAENIGSLGSQTDATNLKYILRVRADEREKAATNRGFYGELAEAVRPYGGIEGYVQHQFEEARKNPRLHVLLMERSRSERRPTAVLTG